MTDRQGRPGSYLVSEPDTRGSRSSTHRPCFTSPLAKFDGSLIASGSTELVEQAQAISSKHEKHYRSTPCAGHVSCKRAIGQCNICEARRRRSAEIPRAIISFALHKSPRF